MRISLTALLLLALATPAAAQTAKPTTYDRAIAAGYKALTVCNAVFTAGRTVAQAEAEELRGIYPEYDEIVPTLTAEVDRSTRTVEVAFDAAILPRHAAWNQDWGCQLDPIGRVGGSWQSSAPIPTFPLGPDPLPWPLGDGAIQPAPSTALAAAINRAFDSQSFGKGAHSIGVVVVHKGRILAERYGPGWGPFVANRTWSVAKSITGTWIGAMNLNPHQPAALREWSGRGDPRRDITLDNLLRMASGLHSDTAGNRTDAIYFGGTAVTEQAPFWPLEAKPGTRFRYANNDILLAAYLASSRPIFSASRPEELLFRPLGMRHTQPGVDWKDNYILSSQVWSTARDLARLGQFWLQDGMWDGRRLLAPGWVKYMTTPSGPQPASGPGYGATLWLFGPAQGLPAGSYAAQGNRGQYVMVVPSADLVLVRRGEDPTGASFDIAAFTADVLKALK